MIHRHPPVGGMMMTDSVQTRVDQESELTTYGNQSGPVVLGVNFVFPRGRFANDNHSPFPSHEAPR